MRLRLLNMNVIKTIELPYFKNPFLIFEKIAHRNWPILLDSHHQISKHRFDIIVCDPIEIVTSHSFSFELLKKYFQKKLPSHEDIPFAGGALGYWNYDGEMAVGIYDFAIVTDHQNQKTFIASYCTQSSTEKLINEIAALISSKNKWNYLNHALVLDDDAKISITDRGFMLADGIFETLLWHKKHILFLEEHWQRLQQAANIIHLNLPLSISEFEKAANDLIIANGLFNKDAAIRLTITRGKSTRGIPIPADSQPTFVITVSELPKETKSNFSLFISSIKRNVHSPLSKIKSTNYLENILARDEALKNGADEAIFFNTDDNLACASVGNIFIVCGDQIYTPRLEDGILPGITRKTVIELCHHLNLDIKETAIDLETLNNATEAFITNSLMGIKSISSINHRILTSNNTITTKIKNSYLNYLQQLTSKEKFKLVSEFKSNFSKENYEKAFSRVKDYLLSGDCYQLNLTQQFSANCYGSLKSIYFKFQKYNPAPFSAFMLLPEMEILSCSPERLFKLKNNIVTTEPIKGTKRRSQDPIEDEQSKQQLQNSEKDRAENVMITDLLRNDLSKVCKPGTVQVTELFGIYSFANVHHLISTIQGELKPHHDAIDLLQHCFPGGSITGAPKKRAMEIIAELEPNKRGIYCGSIGYIGFDGNMDLNIAIRTLVHDKKKQTITCGAGGAIVLDSDCDAEYQECLDKVGNLFSILQEEE